jgi:hypothetical protein
LTAVLAATLLLGGSLGFGQAVRHVAARNKSPNDLSNDQADLARRSVPPNPNQLANWQNRPGAKPSSATSPTSATPSDLGMPRPAVNPGDRSQAKQIPPDESPTWTGPKESTSPGAPFTSSVDAPRGEVVFGGQNGKYAAVLSLNRHDQPDSRLAIIWNRFDLESGKALGEPIELWPWFKGADDAKLTLGPPGWAVAALSGDGNLLALRDPATPGRVDVWDVTGKRLLGLQPFASPQTPIDWVGWSADGRLLIVGQTRLQAWDLSEVRLAYEVFIGGSTLAATISPGHTWVALGAKGGFYLHDTATGRSLGRLRTAEPTAEGWVAVGISPDGKQIAGIVRHKPPAFAPAGVEGWLNRWHGLKNNYDLAWSSLHDVYTWNLDSGQLTKSFALWTDMSRPSGNSLQWCGPTQLLVGGRNVVDLEHNVLSASYVGTSSIVSESPDSRFWCLEPGLAPASTVAKLRAIVPPIRTADEEVVFHPGIMVKVVADSGNPERNKQIETILRTLMDHEGFKDGPAGWTMRVKAEIIDTKERLPQAAGSQNGPTIPAILVTVSLITPDGVVAGSEPYSAVFQRKKSRYYIPPRRGESDTIEKYDFHTSDQNQAITDEIWEELTKPTGWVRWPRGVVKVKDTYLLLPQMRQLDPRPPDRKNDN